MKGIYKAAYQSNNSEAESQEESKHDQPGWKATGVGTGLVASGGMLGGGAATAPLINQLRNSPNTDLGVSKEDLKSQVDENVAEHSPNILGMEEELGYAAAPDDSPVGDLRPELFEGDSDAVLFSPQDSDPDLGAYAHELGHIKNTKDSGTLQEINNYVGPHSLGPVGFAAGGGLGALAATSKNETARKLAPLAAVTPTVPGLIEEGRANLNADKIMRDAGVSGDDLWEGRKTLGKSYAGYLGGAAGLGLGAYGLRKIMDRKYEQSGEEDERAQEEG